ncbi:conserved hypothetical protein [Burkholderiales bacterium 8X]|nr:conserved hypothetical protein [Burkholderiales bacterium 8X]
MTNSSTFNLPDSDVACKPFAPAVPTSQGLEVAALYESPNTPADAPLVLMQHGGSSHKAGLDVQDMAAELVGRRGMRLVALDGPVHGARRESQEEEGLATRGRFFALWESDDAHVARHVAEWRALLDELIARHSPSRIAWVGVSMGTAYGLPLLAAEPRIADAVIGMWGTSFANSAKLLDSARAVRARVLFQQKWDDDLFSREGQLALFDALGSADKRLHVYTGGHVRVAGEQLEDIARFVQHDR